MFGSSPWASGPFTVLQIVLRWFIYTELTITAGDRPAPSLVAAPNRRPWRLTGTGVPLRRLLKVVNLPATHSLRYLPCSHEGEAGEPQRRELSWTGVEGEAGVLGALHDALASPDLVHEHVRALLTAATPSHPPLLGVVAAAAFGRGAGPARLALAVQATRAALTEVELSRAGGGAPLGTSLALEVWSALEVAAVVRLRVADAGAVAALADTRVLARFASLRCLELSHAGLSALPACIGLLTQLQVRGAGPDEARSCAMRRACDSAAHPACCQPPVELSHPHHCPARPTPGAPSGGQLPAHPAPRHRQAHRAASACS